jgi:hypothetical protein
MMQSDGSMSTESVAPAGMFTCRHMLETGNDRPYELWDGKKREERKGCMKEFLKEMRSQKTVHMR